MGFPIITRLRRIAAFISQRDTNVNLWYFHIEVGRDSGDFKIFLYPVENRGVQFTSFSFTFAGSPVQTHAEFQSHMKPSNFSFDISRDCRTQTVVAFENRNFQVFSPWPDTVSMNSPVGIS